jgi:hypothetical protein
MLLLNLLKQDAHLCHGFPPTRNTHHRSGLLLIFGIENRESASWLARKNAVAYTFRHGRAQYTEYCATSIPMFSASSTKT